MTEWTFYHYTSKRGMQDIVDSGHIRESDGRRGDASYGRGVYGTWLNPYKFSQSEVAANNYDGSRRTQRSQMDSGKVDYCIKTTVPKTNLTRIADDGRGILLHSGDVNLQDGNYKVLRVPKE